MSKVGYTNQNRLDPQWVPSDAEMINWVEANQIMVAYDIKPTPVWVAVCTVVPLWKGLAFGATWRAAVEDAMRKEAKLQE